jgi:hypothetical protein
VVVEAAESRCCFCCCCCCRHRCCRRCPLQPLLQKLESLLLLQVLLAVLGRCYCFVASHLLLLKVHLLLYLMLLLLVMLLQHQYCCRRCCYPVPTAHHLHCSTDYQCLKVLQATQCYCRCCPCCCTCRRFLETC